jgi:hypothetical protein
LEIQLNLHIFTYKQTKSNFKSNSMSTVKMATPAKRVSKDKARKLRLKSIVKMAAKNGEGVVGQIKTAYRKSFTKQELINAGFNKNTVYRQTREVDLA